MPFSRSRSIESRTRSATSWLARKAPDCQSMASTRVVLPWSTWATMATLRRSSREAGISTQGMKRVAARRCTRVRPTGRDRSLMNTAPQPDLGGSADGLRSRLLTLLIESVSEYAIFAMDDQGYIVTWNRGAQRLKGYTEDEIVGRHFSTFYTEPDIARDHPAHELEIATREGRYEEEGWRVRKDGTLFWANVVMTALRDEDGQIIGFGKAPRDLTDRRRAEQAREKAATELEEANEQLRTFASAAAHDLAEPLRTVHGFADLLASRYGDRLDDRGREFLEHVQSGSERMQTLIDHLLVYVRAGAPRWRYTDVSSGRAVRRVLSALDAAIEERAAVIDADTDAFPAIHADQ